MKKLTFLIINLMLIYQVNLFAQGRKSADDFPQEKARESQAENSEVPTVSTDENKTNQTKGWAIGVEGGYNWELYQDDFNNYNYNNARPELNAPETGRIGFSVSQGKAGFVGMPKQNQVYNIGYLFLGSEAQSVDNTGWGMYFNTAFHNNFKLGKANNYFYTGFGVGLDFYIYDSNRVDVAMHFVRVPLGFKFMLNGGAELFIEGTFYMGTRIVSNMGDDAWYFDDKPHYGSNYYFDLGMEAKGGVRFWF